MRCPVVGPVGLAAVVLSLLATSALAPQAVGAQSWSPEEQEAIDHLRACWSTWATEDYDTWIRTCNLDPSGSYWDTEQLAPNSMETAEGYLRALVLQGFEDTDVVAWDIRPIRITSWGDVFGVYFYTTLHLRDSDGEVSVAQDRRLEILRKIEGRWGVVGGMSVLDPTRD